MPVFAGLIAGAASGYFTLVIAASLTQGLSGSLQRPMAWGLAAFALAVGFLVGSTVVSRAGRSRERLVLFSGLTAAVGGGIVGAGLVVAILASYLVTYATWPSELLDQILLVLAFPGFGSVGFFAGAACWSVCGLLAGAVLRQSVPRLR